MDYSQMQQQIITTDKSKVLVSCAAASGKTATLIGRLQYLLDREVSPSKIVAITFTNNAASVMYERLGHPNGLFIGSIHSYCNYLLRGGAVDTTKIIQEERFDDLFPEIEEHPDCLQHIEHLLVDEAQDCTKQQFEFFELINPDNYMYFYDYRQSIFGFNGADPTYLINKEKDSEVSVYRMSQNYRNLPNILFFAKKFLYRLGPSYEDDSISMRRSTSGLQQVVDGNYTPQDAVDTLISVNNMLDTNWSDWFVLCRTNLDINLFQKLFAEKDVPTDTFRQADLSNSEIEKKLKENTVKILTVHSAKGLEAPCVLAYNIRAYNDEEARLCYVAATRARDCLIWAKMPPKKKRRKKDIIFWE